MFLLALFLLQAPSIEDHVAAFAKGDQTARAELVKMGAYAIRPLQKARTKAPQAIDELILHLKRAAAWPPMTVYDAEFGGELTLMGPEELSTQSLAAFSLNGIPFFVDRLDPSGLKSTKVKFVIANRSLLVLKAICDQTGVDWGYFHNHIVLGMPERLWPSPPAAMKSAADLERARTLVDQLDDESPMTREVAARELVVMGSGVVPVLKSRLDKTKPELANLCLRLLDLVNPRPGGAFGPPAALRQDLDAKGRAFLRHLEETKPPKYFDPEGLAFLRRSKLLTITFRRGHAIRAIPYLGDRLFDSLCLGTQSHDMDFVIEGRTVIIDSRHVIEGK